MSTNYDDVPRGTYPNLQERTQRRTIAGTLRCQGKTLKGEQCKKAAFHALCACFTHMGQFSVEELSLGVDGYIDKGA